ncbi:MAG: M13 family metallopeptidase [Candidatus Eremiobacteraeota bacterium]|nr:M13 family metallopeptidase [Candidatus Eremiobacteraeota bacterium]
MPSFSRSIRLAGAVAAFLLAANAIVGAQTAVRSGIDPQNFDRTCKPCDDFYQFAVGGWIKNHPVPATKSAVGSFQDLAERNDEVLRGILETAAASHAAAGSDERRIGDYYASCMDTAAIDAAGAKPISPLLADVAGLKDVRSLARLQALLGSRGVGGTFFQFGPRADAHDARTTIAQISQGGLTLPDRDYYLKDDEKTKAIRAAYVTNVGQTLALLGESPDAAAKDAQTVLAVETVLAKNAIARVDQRDPASTDHRMTFAQVQALAPNVDWASLFAGYGVPESVGINVAQPSYLKALSDFLGTANVDDLKTYLRWRVVHDFAPVLAKTFEEANFAFFSKTLNGTPEQAPRWKRCVAAVNGNLGDALGKLYVARTFPPEAKASALAMVQNIKQTFRDDLATLDWMSPETRRRAVAKLDAFVVKIGYPDKWRDYSSLKISRDAYASNQLASNQYRSADAMSRIGKPVDRVRWGMTPPTVNASYNPSANDITFPAGILQPPFYDKDADPAVNYGGIGAVIGHEATHGFDDQGRKFDPYGNLVDWWAAEDSTKFNARADCIVKQYDALSPLPGVPENGKLVQGEAIADLGGLTIAYKAFEKWQAQHPRRTIDGFTPEQRFFIGWAQVWSSNMRPEQVALRAKTDVHAYAKFRVNATFADMPEFAAAWGCKTPELMTRPVAERCQIW